MEFWDKLQKIDAKFIYLILAIAIILPFFFRLGLPIPITKEVRSIYNYVENLTPNDCVIISADYSPSVSPELSPMLDAVTRHCFEKKVKLIAMSHVPVAPGMYQPILEGAADEYNMINGIDYVNLGYRYGFYLVIMRMGSSIEQTFGVDYYGTPLRDLPMMKNIKNYDDVALIVVLTGSNFNTWITFAHEPYQQNIAAGVTAVMAADSYPFLQSGQIIGLMGGLKGAAEYERMNGENYDVPPRMASIGMEAQNWAHIIIILFIIVGNVAYFASKKKKRI
ncbi:MAG: hypothetical protein ACLFSQ_06495 [Candidatus Zixiibacteriota bacterium]